MGSLCCMCGSPRRKDADEELQKELRDVNIFVIDAKELEKLLLLQKDAEQQEDLLLKQEDAKEHVEQ